MKHAVHRTSPKGEGQKFIGRCVNCGMENLPASAALEDCPNVRGVTQDEALIEAITARNTRAALHRPDMAVVERLAEAWVSHEWRHGLFVGEDEGGAAIRKESDAKKVAKAAFLTALHRTAAPDHTALLREAAEAISQVLTWAHEVEGVVVVRRDHVENLRAANIALLARLEKEAGK